MSTSTLAKPTGAPKNFETIRACMSIAFGPSETSAPTFSQAPVFTQSCEIESVLLPLLASMAVATSLESPELQRVVFRVCFFGAPLA